MTPAAPRGWYRCPNVDCLHFWWGAQAALIEKRPVRCTRCDTPVRFYPQRTEHNLGESEDMSERGHGFGWALKQMMDGKRVTRPGWNGKGMYVYDTPAQHDRGEGAAKVDGYFTMRTAQGTLQPGWLISQADARALDWQLYDGEGEYRTETLPIDEHGRTVRLPYASGHSKALLRDPWSIEVRDGCNVDVYLAEYDPEAVIWARMHRPEPDHPWYGDDALHRALAAQPAGLPKTTKEVLDDEATAAVDAWHVRWGRSADPEDHGFLVGDRVRYTEIKPHPLLEITDLLPGGMVRALRCTSPTGAGIRSDRFTCHASQLIPEVLVDRPVARDAGLSASGWYDVWAEQLPGGGRPFSQLTQGERAQWQMLAGRVDGEIAKAVDREVGKFHTGA